MASPLTGRELLIGVAGGIAAYKTAELVSRCVQQGAGVTVIMTDAATQFVGPTTFQTLTGRPVYVHLFRPAEHYRGEHIALADRADLFCIAPATANVLGKLAHGIADDLLTTTALSFAGPLLLAPAMNARMWDKPAVQRNVQAVLADGMHVVGPEEGWLACGTVGVGRMASPEQIAQQIGSLLAATESGTESGIA